MRGILAVTMGMLTSMIGGGLIGSPALTIVGSILFATGFMMVVLEGG